MGAAAEKVTEQSAVAWHAWHFPTLGVVHFPRAITWEEASRINYSLQGLWQLLPQPPQTEVDLNAIPVADIPKTLIQLSAQQSAIAAKQGALAVRWATEPKADDTSDPMLTVGQVAKLLNVSEKTVRRKVKAKRWSFVRDVDGQLRFSQRGLERWLAKQKL